MNNFQVARLNDNEVFVAAGKRGSSTTQDSYILNMNVRSSDAFNPLSN